MNLSLVLRPGGRGGAAGARPHPLLQIAALAVLAGALAVLPVEVVLRITSTPGSSPAAITPKEE